MQEELTMTQKKEYTKRFLARVILEAVSPISLGSGDVDITTDAPVVKDVNGMPYIPGTSIAGVLRHAMGNGNDDSLFGFQKVEKGKEIGMGSKLIFTEGKLVHLNGNVLDGIQEINKREEFFQKYLNLPIRQHVRINSAGTAQDGGKFDEQVAYKGSRFCFEIEYVAEENEDDEVFKTILNKLQSNELRIGSGSRSGFGEMKVVSCKYKSVNFNEFDQRTAYLEKSSSLTETKFWDDVGEFGFGKNVKTLLEYKLSLQPEDFFLFSSGFGNENADISPVTEDYLDWEKNEFVENAILMPASSIKGAISHRVAFHYNRLHEYYIGSKEAKTGKDNFAVKNLFGSEGDKNGSETINKKRGCVMISDVIKLTNKECGSNTKLINHVSIDRFTGGAIEGALFSEEVIYGKDNDFELTLFVEADSLKPKCVKEALEATLNDICTGMLPLGGGVNRGNGIFKGKLTKPNQNENNKSKYEGYLWYSDKPNPEVLNGNEFEIELYSEQNPFLIEGQLFDGKKSISIKYVDGQYFVKEFTIDPNDFNNKDYKIKEFISNEMDSKKLKFLQFWREEPDPLCDGMNVLTPAELVFLGFIN